MQSARQRYLAGVSLFAIITFVGHKTALPSLSRVITFSHHSTIRDPAVLQLDHDHNPPAESKSVNIEEIRRDSSEPTHSAIAKHTNSSTGQLEDTFADSSDFPPCQEESEIDGCRRRSPGAIIVGAKKCGTGTLRHFLSYHPSVKIAPSHEIHYFDSPDSLRYGIDWYRERMGISRPDQLTIEKTTLYFVSSIAPRGIHDQVSPRTKIIILLRDPVTRAVSDFVHERAVSRFTGPIDLHRANGTGKLWTPAKGAMYEVQSTFEQSVLDEEGNVKDWNGVVNVVMYAIHMQMWLDVFPRD